MDVVHHLFIIFMSCLALWKGAAWLVDASSRIAKRMGISELVIGLTVVAFGTSAPEFAVTIGAALRGEMDISVATIIGSNIFNIGFILGGCAIVTTIRINRSIVWRDGLLLFVITAVLVGMLWDQTLSRPEGFILVATLVGYLLFLFWKRSVPLEEEISQEKATWKDGSLLMMGLGLILAGQYFLVDSAVQLAEMIGMSKWLIGLTIVAAGTSIPEFAISMIAIIKKHHGIAAGNLIGSNLFNTLGVLGLAGFIQPLETTQGSSLVISVIAQLALTFVVLIFLWTHSKLTRWEGVVLILLSLIIWGYNFTTTAAT